MKKLIAIVAVLALLAGLTACTLGKTAEQAKPLKAGVWAVVEDGEETGKYIFTDSMKECSYDGGLTGLGFDYEIDGDTYIFHMGSVDDVSKAKIAFTDENNCVITWEDPAREETLVYKGAAEEAESESETEAASAEAADFPPFNVNSEPFVIAAKDGFENAGVTQYVSFCAGKFTFTSDSDDVTWDIYVLDKPFEDGARYLSQAYTPALSGNGVLEIKENDYIYAQCSANAFTADEAPKANLVIDYAE